jgi:hypothetical protein
MKGSSSTTFAQGEHIRTVPLHHPKPSVSFTDLARAKRDWDNGELFNGRPHPAPASARLRYYGGALLTNVQVYVIFWGKKWATPQAAPMKAKLEKFFQAILVSPLMDQLKEYSVPGKVIGHGAYIGNKGITAQAPVGSVTDSTIRLNLKKWITGGLVPAVTKNTLYFIYLDPGIVSIMGGSKSCQNYCGYHDAAGSVYYAVMPYPTCSGCLGGMNAFDALTGTSSHELCEAITDPVPGKGWYDSVNGEIGDICAWHFKQVAGYTVQLEWSNKRNRCI